MPSVVIGDRLIAFGGGSGEEFRDAIHAIGPDGVVEQIGTMPVALRGHQAVQVGDSVYLLGGFNGETRTDAMRWDPRSGRTEHLSPMPRGNAWFAAASYAGGIAVLGGFNIPEGFLDSYWWYDPVRDVWQTKTNCMDRGLFPKGKLGSNALLSEGNTLLSIGGADTFDPVSKKSNALAVVAYFEPGSASWARADSVIRPRADLQAVWGKDADTIYLIGGSRPRRKTPVAEIEVLSTRKAAVATVARLSVPRSVPAVAVLGSNLVIAGGVTGGVYEMSDDIEAVSL